LKARGCTDSRPQREYTEKEEPSSPTVSLQWIMMLCRIDAKEGRYIVVTDIPGVFLHVNLKILYTWYLRALLQNTLLC